MNKKYILCNMNGEYWSDTWGWYWSRSSAKEFSRGAVIACMRQFKKMGIRCYYEKY